MLSKKTKRFFSRRSKGRSRPLLISLCISSGVIGFFLFLFFIHDMPDLNHLESKGRQASIIFESYDGRTIATYGDLFKKVVTVDSLPKHVPNAIIAIEDHRFYEHNGVDFLGIIRAIGINLLNRRIVQGGSTLTQQLAKNLFLSQSKSIKRKIQEFILALWLEKKFTKKQILSIYLNRVYFGSGAYGIDAAAYKFFGKSSAKLTICEAAKLAGVLKSPTLYSPFYNPSKSNERTDLVLTKMYEGKYISKLEMDEAKLEIQNYSKLSVPIDENRYFTDWVLEKMQDIVSVDTEDLIVRTTLDTRLQTNATYVIRDALKNFGFQNGASQMALVALDKTGAVRAMIGGHTYNTSQYNRALALRSFGSAFKFFVYIAALEHGMDIYDQVSDMPITIGDWSPKNFHHKSVGTISLLEAFIQSVNTCAVRLTKEVGIDTVINKAEQMGISNTLSRNYASALGASGVNLLEITSCYGSVMIDGAKMTPFGIISIKNQQGKELYRAHKQKPQIVVSHTICEKMKVMMRELLERGTGKRAKLPIDAYGKTGTSNDSRDASFIGFAYPLVVGVWAGNDDNSPMRSNLTGGTLPAMVWHDFMLIAFKYKEPKSATEISPKHQRKHKKLSAFVNEL